MEHYALYCGLMIKSGGIIRFNYHLSHMDHHSNTKKCPNVSSKVKQEIKQLLKQKNKTKTKKVAVIKEIQAELHDIVGGKHQTTINDEEEEEGDENVYMHPVDMHSMNEMNIKKQYTHQKLVNRIKNKLKNL